MTWNCCKVKFSSNFATFLVFRRHLIKKSRWMNTLKPPSILCLTIWKQVQFLRRHEKSEDGMKSPWYEQYEKSNDGTKNLWYESSMVRNVHQWYETSKVRKVYGMKSPAFETSINQFAYLLSNELGETA